VADGKLNTIEHPTPDFFGPSSTLLFYTALLPRALFSIGASNDIEGNIV